MVQFSVPGNVCFLILFDYAARLINSHFSSQISVFLYFFCISYLSKKYWHNSPVLLDSICWRKKQNSNNRISCHEDWLPGCGRILGIWKPEDKIQGQAWIYSKFKAMWDPVLEDLKIKLGSVILRNETWRPELMCLPLCKLIRVGQQAMQCPLGKGQRQRCSSWGASESLNCWKGFERGNLRESFSDCGMDYLSRVREKQKRKVIGTSTLKMKSPGKEWERRREKRKAWLKRSSMNSASQITGKTQ